MRPGDFSAAQRPELHVFYILDTSGSMNGNPIGVLNRAMDSTIDALRQVAAHNSNVRVKVAVLAFNTSARWVTNHGPEDLECFDWDDLQAQGMTYVGNALEELESKLHRNEFLASSAGALPPVLIFMTDGRAVDDYEAALNNIRRNRWFSKATRIGFAIGKNPDVGMIARLTGDSEAVIRTDNLGLFASMIESVSKSSVMMSSQSYISESEVAGSDVVQDAARNAGIGHDDYYSGFDYDESGGTVLVDGGSLRNGRSF